jgi:hypothetical protein
MGPGKLLHSALSSRVSQSFREIRILVESKKRLTDCLAIFWRDDDSV